MEICIIRSATAKCSQFLFLPFTVQTRLTPILIIKDLPNPLFLLFFFSFFKTKTRSPVSYTHLYDDPDAAQIVFKSGVPLVMCGLDVTMQAELRPADWDEMAAYGNRCGKLVRELFACAWSAVQTVGLTGVAQHDSCPIMYLAHPELFEGQMAGVFVETQAEITLGKTVTDLQSDKKFGKKNALVLLKLCLLYTSRCV